MLKNKLGFLCFSLMWACVVSAQVEVSELPELHIGTVGIKTELTSEIWGEHPDPNAVISQIQEMADVNLNENERSWLRQILLTDAGGIDTLEQNHEAFLKARLETLLAQGLFDDAIRLVNQIDQNQKNMMAQRYRITALFAKGNITEACQENALSFFEEEEPFVRVACAWEQKTPNEVELAYHVYQETNHQEHPFLTAAAETLYLGKENPLPAGIPSLWEIPLLAANRPDEMATLPLNRGGLLVMSSHTSIPIGVRDQAIVRLYAPRHQKIDADELLKRLKSVAEARQKWEEGRP